MIRPARAPRVALITPLWPQPGAGYAGKPIYRTALALRELCAVDAVCPGARYPRLRWLEPASYDYHRVAGGKGPPDVATDYVEYFMLPWIGRFWSGWGTLRAIEPAVRRIKPDVLLSYWLYPTGWAAVHLGRRLGVPVLVGSRGSDLHRIASEWIRRRTAWTVRNAAAVLTVTRDLAEQAQALGAAPERVHVIANGCDRALYRPQPQTEARLALGLAPDAQLLLQVGHLIESKGIFDLWAAFEKLAPGQPALRLAFVGEGPAEAALRAKARDSGLADRLLLPGPQSPGQVAQWMNAAGVVCLASHGEGCPNVVIEALACGRPVVGCRVGGIPDLVDRECGRLVPARRPEELARGIEEVLAGQWDSARISRRHARSWAEVAGETFTEIERQLRRPAP
jgi:glycosyltransferase involved in cell wall biosynthesis